MPFIFEGYARKIKNPVAPGNYIGVWTDGVLISSDDAPMCAFPLEEGEKYKITIDLIPLYAFPLEEDKSDNSKKRIFLYLQKEYETPFFKFNKGYSTYSDIWAGLLGVSHKDFLEKYNEDEIFASWFSEEEIK